MGSHCHLLNDDVEAAVRVMFPELVECVKEMFMKGFNKMVKESIPKEVIFKLKPSKPY